MAVIYPAVSEEKMFEECGRQTITDDDACLYYKLKHDPKSSGELRDKTLNLSVNNRVGQVRIYSISYLECIQGIITRL